MAAATAEHHSSGAETAGRTARAGRWARLATHTQTHTHTHAQPLTHPQTHTYTYTHTHTRTRTHIAREHTHTHTPTPVFAGGRGAVPASGNLLQAGVCDGPAAPFLDPHINYVCAFDMNV